MQPKIIREYHIFLASPSEVDAERKEVRDFFESFNRHTAARWNVRFTVVDWENYSNIGIGRPQELITKQTLEKFRDSLVLVVGIMGQRFGSPTGTHESGTEEEFEWSLNAYLQAGFPEIKWFFRNIEGFQTKTSEPEEIEKALEQWKKVRAFKQKLAANQPPLYYGTFSDSADFREKFREDLSRWLNADERPWHDQIEHLETTATADLSNKYYDFLIQSFKSLDIAGIDNDRAVDIPLSEIYVRLRVIRDEDNLSDEDFSDNSPLDIHAALNLYRRLVIVGDPGSGKSTFLKFIALMIARAKIENDPGLAIAKLSLPEPLPIPFFLSLWELSDFINRTGKSNSDTILQFILNRLAEAGVSLTQNHLEEMLHSGNCCLLFDGLDEVPTEHGRALISRLVEAFVSRFNKNRFVVTSRVRGYTGGAILKNEFVRCDIQNFDENDRREFLRNWFAALLKIEKDEVLKEGSRSRTEFDTLQASIETKDRIRQLAVNPLLMTVIAIVHWNRKRLPDQRVDLYDECIDVLLGQRKDAEQRIGSAAKADILNPEKEVEIHFDRVWVRKRCAEIAFLILENGANDEITRETVIKFLAPKFIDRGARNQEEAEHKAEHFLEQQEFRSGLLVSRKSGSCRFVHLTFQEYLAAWHLANQSLSDVKETIVAQIRNPQWFETLQLLGGELAKNSDEKLDELISFLLDNLGNKIRDKAPVIALCANILRDVRDVADIKAETRERFTQALRGTLNAFKPNSRISPVIQLEVLVALSKLGASVKEHLVQATKSDYFQVRSEALTMLIEHLSDDDLFAMQHILTDRSQETRAVYFPALFERDAERAKEIFLNPNIRFDSKDAKAIYVIFTNFLNNFSIEEVLHFIRRCVGNLFHETYWYKTLNYLSKRRNYRDSLVELLIEIIETNKVYVMWWLARTFDQNSTVREYVNIKAVDKNNPEIQEMALRVIADNPKLFVGSWESLIETVMQARRYGVLTQAVEALAAIFPTYDFTWKFISDLMINSEDDEVRIRFFQLLVKRYAKDRIDELILIYNLEISGYNLFDPINLISNLRIENSAKRFNEPVSKMRDRFERLAKFLPIKLESEAKN
jgi:hypothetical protein